MARPSRAPLADASDRSSNPPGNEGKLADFLQKRFAGLGFEIDIIPTPQPGKCISSRASRRWRKRPI